MKRLFIVIITLLTVTFSNASASDTKVNGRLYTDWTLETSDDVDSENSFSISRAYVTVKSKLSDFTSVRITTDIREVDNFSGYTIILKYGYFDWKPKFGNGKLKVRFGLHATPYIDRMNKLWGRRYMLKTASDLNKFVTSSDLGAGLIFGLGEKGKTGSASVHIFNGSSYSHIEDENKNKNINAHILLNPFINNEKLKRSQVQAQAYLGTQNETIADNEDASDYKMQLFSFGGLLGYNNTFDLGLDLNFLTEGPGNALDDDIKSSAFSLFGTLYFADLVENESFVRTLNLFGRFDIFDPDRDMDDDGEFMFVAGIECNPVKGFKASLNYKTINPEDDSQNSMSYLSINTLVKF
ncbi:MAG: hypothetical protein DRP35_00485 [Candidatus Zixiibacteriota bacterium]|nr:MAG: hypothetical protein DRP35_00485 [candidate division Zixibacteria bacterium]